MTPREHLQKMLGDQGNLEGKQLYQLTGCMSAAELRQRQEIIMRNQMMSVNPQVVMQTQQRVPGVAPQYEHRYLDRDLLPSTEIILPNDTRQMHMTSQFGPSGSAHLSNRVFPGPGYGFLQTEPLEVVARRQDLLQKQSINRMEMEMNAFYQPREMDKALRKGFADLDSPFLYHGIAASPVAIRGRQMLSEGHLPTDVFVHQNAYESLQGHTMVKTTRAYHPLSSLQRERARRPGRRAGNQKATDIHACPSKSQAENKPHASPPTADEDKDDKKEEETEPFSTCDLEKAGTEPAMDKSSMELQESSEKDGGNHTIPSEADSSRNGNDKVLSNPGASFEDRYMYQPTVHLSAAAAYSFPVAINSSLLSGAHSLFLNREDIPTIEDIRKWTSEDVYNFIISLPGCSGYAQVFKDHDIDGLTLPLLTEEHLLDTMGLKLGPALKIRSQISCRLGNIFHMANLHLPGPMPSTAAPMPSDRPSEVAYLVPCNSSGDTLPSPCSQDPDALKAAEIIVSENKENPSELLMPQTDFQMNFLKS
ncbi:sterile alpha motif domain-containing protein 7 isoform X1 [Ascaphus truei]|uniref:sterile alpha motif domain-containing protein 7 isoform X1 n=2 Tax=Ascaphus truei TaxID=8439 RepID=UPI003F596F16